MRDVRISATCSASCTHFQFVFFVENHEERHTERASVCERTRSRPPGECSYISIVTRPHLQIFKFRPSDSEMSVLKQTAFKTIFIPVLWLRYWGSNIELSGFKMLALPG